MEIRCVRVSDEIEGDTTCVGGCGECETGSGRVTISERIDMGNGCVGVTEGRVTRTVGV